MQGDGRGVGPNVSRAIDWNSVGWGLRLQGWPERRRGRLSPTSRRPHAIVESLHNPDVLSITLSIQSEMRKTAASCFQTCTAVHRHDLVVTIMAKQDTMSMLT